MVKTDVKQARKLRREIKADHKPDYYETRIIEVSGRAAMQRYKRHSSALMVANNAAKLNQTIKVRIFHIRYKFGLPIAERIEYIKGDRIN